MALLLTIIGSKTHQWNLSGQWSKQKKTRINVAFGSNNPICEPKSCFTRQNCAQPCSQIHTATKSENKINPIRDGQRTAPEQLFDIVWSYDFAGSRVEATWSQNKKKWFRISYPLYRHGSLCLFTKPRILWPEPQAGDAMFSCCYRRCVPVAQTKSEK